MRARIIQVGNSRGIRIPQPLLKQTGLAGEVDLLIEDNRLVIAPVAPEREPPRTGWAKAFKAMAMAGDDSLLDGTRRPSSRWDREEWEWE